GGSPAPVRQGALPEAHAGGARGIVAGAAPGGASGGPARGEASGGPVRGADPALSGSVVRRTPRSSAQAGAENVRGCHVVVWRSGNGELRAEPRSIGVREAGPPIDV